MKNRIFWQKYGEKNADSFEEEKLNSKEKNKCVEANRCVMMSYRCTFFRSALQLQDHLGNVVELWHLPAQHRSERREAVGAVQLRRCERCFHTSNSLFLRAEYLKSEIKNRERKNQKGQRDKGEERYKSNKLQ